MTTAGTPSCDLTHSSVQSPANHRAAALTDEEALSQIKKGHDTMCVMLSSRHKNLQTVRAVWVRDDVKVSFL